VLDGSAKSLDRIVYPSATFVRIYEPWVSWPNAGAFFQRRAPKTKPDEVGARDRPNAEFRIIVPGIRRNAPGTVSVMPAVLDVTTQAVKSWPIRGRVQKANR